MRLVCLKPVKKGLKNMAVLQRMRLGVERDMERQFKKEENRRKLEEQRILEEALKNRDNKRIQ